MKFRFKCLFYFCPALVACFLLFGARAADAQCVAEQTHKLLANDGAAEDHFGTDVAVNETTAIVGAIGDFNAVNAGPGSAYVFDTTTGQQLHKLLPNDSVAGDRFGISVAISGTIALVGAHEAAGSAYVFDLSTGQQIAQFFTDDGAWDNFGASVAISGTTAIIGAAFDDDNGSNSGSAYLFDLTTMEQIAKLHPSDPSSGDFFGNSVAISGTTAIVGARQDDDNGETSGSAYLFDTATGQQLHKLRPVDGAAWDWFGTSVGISGTTAIVSAPGDGDNGEDSGSAYLFDTTTGQQLRKLLPVDGAADDDFGGGVRGVAISGSTAIVGARYDDDNGNSSGSAYLFDTVTGQQLHKVLPKDGAEISNFGVSVGISGTNTIVGAWQDGDNGNNSGSAYLFEIDCGEVVTADQYNIFRGFHISGDLSDSFDSDDSYLKFNPGMTINSSEAPVWLIFDGILPSDNPNSLEIVMESNAGTPGLTHTLEAWNWTSMAYDVVDVSTASFNDDVVVTASLSSQISDYAQTVTGAVRTRVGWRKTGMIINSPWEVRLDQMVWIVQ